MHHATNAGCSTSICLARFLIAHAARCGTEQPITPNTLCHRAGTPGQMTQCSNPYSYPPLLQKKPRKSSFKSAENFSSASTISREVSERRLGTSLESNAVDTPFPPKGWAPVEGRLLISVVHSLGAWSCARISAEITLRGSFKQTSAAARSRARSLVTKAEWSLSNVAMEIGRTPQPSGMRAAVVTSQSARQGWWRRAFVRGRASLCIKSRICEALTAASSCPVHDGLIVTYEDEGPSQEEAREIRSKGRLLNGHSNPPATCTSINGGATLTPMERSGDKRPAAP
eukprot:scaffold33992_cov31-Tisochrysis_lutea.AAC.4